MRPIKFWKSDTSLRLLVIGCLAFIVTAFAQSPPNALRLEHSSYGYTTPFNSSYNSLDEVTWVTACNADTGFGRASGGVLGDYAYCFGSSTQQARAYNWQDLTWAMSTAPPLGDCNWAGVATEEAIYLIGRYSNYTFGTEVQKFTPTGSGPEGVWSEVADYPLALAGISADWDGENTIYAAGGSDLFQVVAQAFRYDITSDTWSSIAPLPEPNTYAGGAFLQGKFHVVGGLENPAAHYVYDPDTDTWSNAAPLPIPNHFTLFSLTHNEDCLMAVGGGGGYYTWQATNAVQLYFPETSSWLQETPLPETHGLSSAAYLPDDSVLSGGGFDEYCFTAHAFKGGGFPSSGSSGIEQSFTVVSPANFGLQPAYPNPFNAATTLEFALASPGKIELIIYDLRGREIRRLAEGHYSAGVHRINFSAGGLPSGIYLCALQTETGQMRQKLVLLK